LSNFQQGVVRGRRQTKQARQAAAQRPKPVQSGQPVQGLGTAQSAGAVEPEKQAAAAQPTGTQGAPQDSGPAQQAEAAAQETAAPQGAAEGSQDGLPQRSGQPVAGAREGAQPSGLPQVGGQASGLPQRGGQSAAAAPGAGAEGPQPSGRTAAGAREGAQPNGLPQPGQRTNGLPQPKLQGDIFAAALEPDQQDQAGSQPGTLARPAAPQTNGLPQPSRRDLESPTVFHESGQLPIPAAPPSALPSRKAPETPAPRREESAFEATAEWNFGTDDGWRAVQAVSQSTPSTFTSAGLPRRRRGAQLLPGSAGPSTGATAPRPQRDAHDVRGRLRSFQQGIERGRHRTAQAAETNHETLEGE
jgi:hypothetical protein